MWRRKNKQSEGEILKEIEDKITTTEYIRHAYERQWFFNLAFLAGKHYVEFNTTTRELFEPNAPSWRVRLVVNLIRQQFQTRLAKLLKARPIREVLPASTERDDVTSAQVAKAVLEYYETVLNNPITLIDQWSWALSCGSGYKHPYWDDEKKDVRSDVVSPFEMVFDPIAQKIENAQWCIRTRTYKKEILEDKFNRKIETAEEENPYGAIEQMMSHLQLKTPFSVQTDTDKCITVHEYWEIPTKKFPNGRHDIATIDTLLDSKDLPKEYRLKDKEPVLPFVKYDDLKLPGRFAGVSFIEDAIPMNKELDKTCSQIIEIKNLMAKPKWLIPSNSGIPDNSLTTEPAERVVYQTGAKPESWAPNVLQPQWFALIELIIKLNDDVIGQHEVTKAQTPTGVTAGIAIRSLQEQDDSRLQPSLYAFEASYEREGMMILDILKTRQTGEKTVAIVGKHKKHEVLKWKSKELQGKWVVKVQAGSAYPRYKVSWQSYVLELFKLGVIRDEDRILKLLELPEAREEISMDESRAAIENDNMIEGKKEPVEKWHNHIVDLKVHNEVRNSQEWREFSDIVKRQFVGHCEQHQAMLEEQIQRMRIMQGEGQPSPGTQKPQAQAAGAGLMEGG